MLQSQVACWSRGVGQALSVHLSQRAMRSERTFGGPEN
jgi:hypothetical protein